VPLIRIAGCKGLRSEIDRLDIEAFGTAIFHVSVGSQPAFANVAIGEGLCYLLSVSFRAKNRLQ